MKKLAVFVAFSLMISCKQAPSTCETPKQGHAVLIGYKRAKHSYLFFKLTELNSYHKISCGRRKAPTLEIGDVIDVNYCISGNEVELLIDGYKYSSGNNWKTGEHGNTW